jgi:hypothetical protein
MTREEFKTHVEGTIEGVIQDAEKRVGCQLTRSYCFGWIGATSEPVPQEQVSEFITQNTYIDAEHIYPCFDIGVGEILDDGRLLLVGYRAGYPPRPWGKNWAGRDGPFVPIMGQKFLDKFPDVQRRDMVRVARDILASNMGIVDGARKLSPLRFSPLTAQDKDIRVFVNIANETSELFTGEGRRLLNGEALKANDEKLRNYESCARDRVFRACEGIIIKFGEAHGGNIRG